MVYDCFIFNDEIDLLLLRLEFLHKVVDKFVIVESEYSFSGNPKPLYFWDNRERFNKYNDRIIYDSIPARYYMPGDAWANEYFQRNYIKNSLAGLADEDLVHISDADEILDFPSIFAKYKIDRPSLVELPVYNYFFNLRSRAVFKVNLLTPYRYIRETPIGNREHYRNFADQAIEIKDGRTGWHFSYLFGFNIARYQEKLRNFSHQEFNTPHFVQAKRIRALLSVRADILERNSVLTIVRPEEEMGPELTAAINRAGFDDTYFYKKPGAGFYLKPYNLFYFIRFSIKPRLKLWLTQFIGKPNTLGNGN